MFTVTGRISAHSITHKGVKSSSDVELKYKMEVHTSEWVIRAWRILTMSLKFGNSTTHRDAEMSGCVSVIPGSIHLFTESSSGMQMHQGV